MAVALTTKFIEREIESEFGVTKRWNEDGNVVLVGGFKDATALGIFLQEFTDSSMELVATNHFFRAPFFQNAIDHFFYVIKVGLWLQRIVHAIVSGEEELIVVHFRGI